MTTERPQTGSTGSSGDDSRDPAVSRLYRQLATERTPAHIDAVVLREAGKAAESYYARSVHWMRPLAWAATVGLCLAIVVELSIDPLLMPEMRDADIAAPDAAKPARDDSADSTVTADSEADPQRPDETPLFERIAPANQPLGDAGPGAQATESSSTATAAPEINDSFVPQETSIVEEAEMQARLREGSVAPPLPAVVADRPDTSGQGDDRQAGLPDDPAAKAADSGLQAREQSVVAQAVDARSLDESNDATAEAAARLERRAPAAADTRGFAALVLPENAITPEIAAEPCNEAWPEAPEQWLECIEALETAGRDDEALRQRDLLAEAFPDFAER